MKLIIVRILILLVATQAFSKWVILLEYEWNKEYIAQTLCKNKAKPKLKCEGKCQVAKKMAAEEEPSSPTPSQKLKFQEVVFANEAMRPMILQPQHLISTEFLTYLFPVYTPPVFSVFHPPA